MARYLTPAETRLVDHFVALLEARLPAGALRGVTLFGSRARGDAGARSDIDVAVEVADPASVTRHAVADAAHDAMLELDGFGLGLNPVVMREGEGGGLRPALDRDGKRLWPRAA